MTLEPKHKWPRIVYTIIPIAFLGAFAWFALRPGEPVYQGRTLTSWLEQIVNNNSFATGLTGQSKVLRDEAKIAVQHVGTNAIPILLRMASAHDSELKSNVLVLVERVLPIHPRRANDSQNMAMFGFFALGQLGKDAVPSLIQLLKSPYEDVRSTAADSLGDIGPEAEVAVPLFLPMLNNSNHITRWDTTLNLGRIHCRPDLVVPRLTQDLNPSNTILATTILALEEFGSDAKVAVPAILPYFDE